MVSYVIVEFIETGACSVVPENWLKDNYCFWPPDDMAKKLQSFLQKGTQVSYGETWSRYAVRVRGDIYESYAAAQVKLKKVLETSNVDTSDVENYGRGRRHKKASYKRKSESLYSSSDSEGETRISAPPAYVPSKPDQVSVQNDELTLDTEQLIGNNHLVVESDQFCVNSEEEQDNSESLLENYQHFLDGITGTPTHNIHAKTSTQQLEASGQAACRNIVPGQLPIRNVSKINSGSCIRAQNAPIRTLSHESPTNQPSESRLPNKCPGNKRFAMKSRQPVTESWLPYHCPTKNRVLMESGQLMTESRLPYHYPMNNRVPTESGQPMTAFERSVVRTLEVLKMKTDLILKNQDLIIQKINIQESLLPSPTMDSTSKIQHLLALMPLSTMSDIDYVESELLEEEKSENMKYYLKGIGGDSVEVIVRSMLKRVFTDEGANFFSFLGRRGKKSFKQLTMYKVILGSVKMSHKCSTITEFDVDKCIESWLRHAKARMNGGDGKGPRKSM